MYYKSFAIVIYDRNDRQRPGLKNLAIARIANYDHKVRCEVKHTSIWNYLAIVINDGKTFVVQAKGGAIDSIYVSHPIFFEKRRIHNSSTTT